MLQITAVLLVLVTVAVSCCVWPPYNVAADGLTLTAIGGSSVIAADADFVVFAWLVAVTVTVVALATLAGAVYRPVELTVPVPTGLILQVRAVLLVFVTVAVNCCVWPPYNVAVAGLTITATGGDNVTVAEADFDVFAWLVAVTVTVVAPLMLAGAV
jgi:cellobiose-specific phosphotransferase system component IIC